MDIHKRFENTLVLLAVIGTGTVLLGAIFIITWIIKSIVISML